MTKKDRQLATNRMAKCRCGNVALLNETYCSQHEPITLEYETDAMHQLRCILEAQGFTAFDISVFKECLVTLERQGFALRKKESR